MPRDPWLLLPAGLGLAALVWLGVSAVVHGGLSKQRQPTIGEQVASIRSKGAGGTRSAETPNPVDFHGTGQDSYVFSFRAANRAAADEIQVWDVVGGDQLRERFRFQPDTPAVFQFRGSADIDGDGEEELIGGYGPTTHSGEMLVPFALDWNDDKGSYQIVDLQPKPPSFDLKLRGVARKVTRPYRQLTAYEDGNGNAVRGYPAQDFGLVPDGNRLVSGYIVGNASPAPLDVEVETFDTQAADPQLRNCDLPGHAPIQAQEQPGAFLYNVLIEKWDAISAHQRCAPTVEAHRSGRETK